jgi:hypothetical protein
MLEERMKTALTDDLLLQYVQYLQKRMGMKLNPQAIRNALGVESDALAGAIQP